jgi:hypothetical protein
MTNCGLQIAPLFRLHWRPRRNDERAGDSFLGLAIAAEKAGMESANVPGGIPEALTLAAEAGMQTVHLRFRVSCDLSDNPLRLHAGVLLETAKTLGKRLILHVRPREAEMASAEEFMNQYIEFSRGVGPTELHVEGDTAEAAFLAIKYADVLWRRPDRPEQVYADALPVLHFGKEVGLVTSALSGSFREIVEPLCRFRDKGISQFLLDGLPDDLVCTMERGSVAVG